MCSNLKPNATTHEALFETTVLLGLEAHAMWVRKRAHSSTSLRAKGGGHEWEIFESRPQLRVLFFSGTCRRELLL
jgi:hypothetical protein